MLSPSRHGRQGGVDAEDKVQDGENCGIMPYEQERNRRKRQLHDEVQYALLSSGFAEAAELRSIFSGEVRKEREGDTKIGKESCRRHRNSLGDGATEVCRSTRNVDNTKMTSKTIAVQRTRKPYVSEYVGLTTSSVCMQCELHISTCMSGNSRVLVTLSLYTTEE